MTENPQEDVLELRGKIAFLEYMAFESFRLLPDHQRAELAHRTEALVGQMTVQAGRASAELLRQKLRVHLLLKT